MGFSRHDVNHFYNVLRHVIGLWLSLANSPGFGMTDGFPPENQRDYFWAPWVMAWNVLTTPCSDRARFHQNFVILSSPGALQFLFFLITFTAFSLSKMKISSEKGAGTRRLIAVFTSSNQLPHFFPEPFLSHNSFQKLLGSSIFSNISRSSSLLG